ncbi:acetyl-CoA carboxylase biotin carboxyl carrier protein [Oscillatoria sp. FACHB-1406]|uniref:acetyl-CoA carboxylase biotin carboxyl carrier protein n=1 Tax=Oscillatoria sp. FACHB-1406 TaxID=2692846 RepID=UPI0016863662|nr:acetyl-CoA carboxylase biotin carboxyl carrier protein [Oscillatoria sp. FACHB-1406]
MSIDINQLRELLSAIAQTDIAELTLKSDEFELTVRRGVAATVPSIAASETLMTTIAAAPSAAPVASVLPAVVPAPQESSPPPANEFKGAEIVSPMVGTFYRAPGPDEAPFIAVGERVRTGQTVCIIEAMKLMNEIESEVSGQIVEIMVENGQPVEYGQVLMRVKPD